MIIQLNVLQDGSCARIFAFKEPNEENWGNYSSSIKIWHNQEKKSIERHFKTPVWHENDYIIEFKSKISFREFCNLFWLSEYNDGEKYHFYWHNCANAANYALKIAGIDLGISPIKLTSLCPHPITRIPTPFLSPIDLFHHAKRYYEKTDETLLDALKHSHQIAKSNQFKFELANKALLFWGNKQSKNNKKLKDTTIDLEKAITLHQKKYPHRIPIYHQKVIQAIDLMLTPKITKTDEERTQERDESNQFKDRQTFNLTRVVDINLNFLLLFEIYCFSSLLFTLLFSTKATDTIDEDQSVLNSLLLFFINYMFVVAIASIPLCAMKKMKEYAFLRDQELGHQLTKDTPLSQAIEAYEKAIHMNTETQEQEKEHLMLEDVFSDSLKKKDEATFNIRL